MKTILFLFSALSSILVFFFYYFNGITLDSLFFTFLYGIIFFSALFFKKDKAKIDIFRPYYLTSILLYLYSVAAILYVNETNLTLYGEFVSESLYISFIFASLLTQVGLSLGFVIQSRLGFEPNRAKKSSLMKESSSEINYLLFFTVLFSIAFLPFYYDNFLPSAAVSYSDWSLQSRVERLGDNTSGIREILFETFPTILLLCSSIYISFNKKINLFLRLAALILLLSFMYTQFLSGARYTLVLSMILIATYINFKFYKFNFLQVILGGILVYILINLLGLLRVTANPIEMFYLLTDEIGLSGLSFLSLQSSSELLTSLNTVRVIDAIDSGQTNFQYGTLFVDQILAFIPKFIWAGRPELASELYVKTFYPGIYESGGGFGFSIVAEGYWELGLFGCLIYGFMTGIIGEKFFQMFSKAKNNDVYIFLYALIFSRIVISINRGGLIASLKAAIIIAAPILFIIIIYKIIQLFKKNENTMDT